MIVHSKSKTINRL